MKATFNNFQLLADKELYEAMLEKYGAQSYGKNKMAIKTNNSFASWMIAEAVYGQGDLYKIVPITSQNNERQSLQMEAYWTTLKEFPISEYSNVPQFYRQWFRNRDLIKEVIQKRLEDRDYKDEYKNFQSSKKNKKYRAELNKYNRDKGTYGNGDGKDASHKNGKISGFEKSSTNKGRREKSRLKKESNKMGITKVRLREIIIEEYQKLTENKVAVYIEIPTKDFISWENKHEDELKKINGGKYKFQRMEHGKGNKKEIWQDDERGAKATLQLMKKTGLKPKGIGERNGFVEPTPYRTGRK
jgi:hypothetical protein